MKLTIIRLQHFSDQDRIDLGKIWPSQDPAALMLDENHRIYAARFNERLLGAVRVTLRGVEGELSDLCVREVTRRRGVGQYLVEETLSDNPNINSWRVADRGGGRLRRDGGVYAGARFQRPAEWLGEALSRSPNKRSVTREEPGGASLSRATWKL